MPHLARQAQDGSGRVRLGARRLLVEGRPIEAAPGVLQLGAAVAVAVQPVADVLQPPLSGALGIPALCAVRLSVQPHVARNS